MGKYETHTHCVFVRRVPRINSKLWRDFAFRFQGCQDAWIRDNPCVTGFGWMAFQSSEDAVIAIRFLNRFHFNGQSRPLEAAWAEKGGHAHEANTVPPEPRDDEEEYRPKRAFIPPPRPEGRKSRPRAPLRITDFGSEEDEIDEWPPRQQQQGGYGTSEDEEVVADPRNELPSNVRSASLDKSRKTSEEPMANVLAPEISNVQGKKPMEVFVGKSIRKKPQQASPSSQPAAAETVVAEPSPFDAAPVNAALRARRNAEAEEAARKRDMHKVVQYMGDSESSDEEVEVIIDGVTRTVRHPRARKGRRGEEALRAIQWAETFAKSDKSTAKAQAQAQLDSEATEINKKSLAAVNESDAGRAEAQDLFDDMFSDDGTTAQQVPKEGSHQPQPEEAIPDEVQRTSRKGSHDSSLQNEVSHLEQPQQVNLLDDEIEVSSEAQEDSATRPQLTLAQNTQGQSLPPGADYREDRSDVQGLEKALSKICVKDESSENNSKIQSRPPITTFHAGPIQVGAQGRELEAYPVVDEVVGDSEHQNSTDNDEASDPELACQVQSKMRIVEKNVNDPRFGCTQQDIISRQIVNWAPNPNVGDAGAVKSGYQGSRATSGKNENGLTKYEEKRQARQEALRLGPRPREITPDDDFDNDAARHQIAQPIFRPHKRPREYETLQEASSLSGHEGPRNLEAYNAPRETARQPFATGANSRPLPHGKPRIPPRLELDQQDQIEAAASASWHQFALQEAPRNQLKTFGSPSPRPAQPHQETELEELRRMLEEAKVREQEANARADAAEKERDRAKIALSENEASLDDEPSHAIHALDRQEPETSLKAAHQMQGQEESKLPIGFNDLRTERLEYVKNLLTNIMYVKNVPKEFDEKTWNKFVRSQMRVNNLEGFECSWFEARLRIGCVRFESATHATRACNHFHGIKMSDRALAAKVNDMDDVDLSASPRKKNVMRKVGFTPDTSEFGEVRTPREEEYHRARLSVVQENEVPRSAYQPQRRSYLAQGQTVDDRQPHQIDGDYGEQRRPYAGQERRQSSPPSVIPAADFFAQYFSNPSRVKRDSSTRRIPTREQQAERFSDRFVGKI